MEGVEAPRGVDVARDNQLLRQALQRAQVLREPGGIAGPDGLDEAVVHQLDPRIPAPRLAAHQEALL